MGIHVSPGAYVREIDLSLYVPSISTTIFGVCGTASKGPINGATFVSSQADYVRKFGNPDPKHLMSYAALQYLRRGTKLWVVRVATSEALEASATLDAGPTPGEVESEPNPWTFFAPAGGEVTGDVLGPYDFTGGENILKLNVLDETGTDIPRSPFTVTLGTSASEGCQVVANDIMDEVNAVVIIAENGENYAVNAGVDDTIRVAIRNASRFAISATDAPSLTGSETDLEHVFAGYTEGAATAAELASSINADAGPGIGDHIFAEDIGGVLHLKALHRFATITFRTPSSQDGTITVLGAGVTIDQVVYPRAYVQANAVDTSDGSPTTIYDPASLTASAYLRLRSVYHTGVLSGIIVDDLGGGSTSTDELGLDSPTGFNQLIPTGEGVKTYQPENVLNPGYNGRNKLTIKVGDGVTTDATETFEFSSGVAITAENTRQVLLNGTNQPKLDSLGVTVYVTSDNRIVFRRTNTPGDPNTPLVPLATHWIQADSATTTVRQSGGSGNDNDVWTDFSQKLSDPGGGATATISAVTKGTWGNNLRIKTSNGSEEGTFRLIVEEKNPVTNLWATAELWDNLDYQSGGDYYWEDAINAEIGGSDYIVVNDTGADSVPNAGVNGLILTNGHDGEGTIGTPITDAHYIGTNPAPTGLQIFKSAELLDVNLIATPGISSASVILSMLQICEDRGDCMAIIDPPMGLSAQQVVDWHNGNPPYTGHAAFNSSYGALYWPWIKVYDSYNDVNVTTAPSGHVAGVIAYTDYSRQLWFAPAGLQRGLLPSALDLETTSPSQGERDLMNGYPNNVNPIVKFNGVGIAVYGQKTLNRLPQATDRVNVRRLLLYTRKIIASTIRYLVFEPNDPTTWRSFVRLVQPWFENIRQKRGLVDFQVQCDETLNPPEEIDNGTMHGRIYLKPTKAAEKIEVDFVVTATGASFDDITF